MEGQRSAGTNLSQKLNSTAPTVKDRLSTDWIDTFVEYASGFPSPAIFKKWGAICAVAMALERKVWLRTNIGPLYPNLYVMLIAPPGVGKSLITSAIQDLVGELSGHHTAPSSVSRASLVDALMGAERRIVAPQLTPSVLSFNSLAVIQNEMGVFLPAYDTEFMATLTDLYDCKRYHEKKRSKEINNTMSAPQLNLLGATTVAYLYDTMPEQAWDHGFLSRTILIHSGEMIIRSIFDVIERPESLFKQLVTDLQTIGALVGKFTFTPETAKAIDAWHQAGGPPKPDHPKLSSYCARRTSHLLKLSMVACVSRSNELLITIDDYHRALEWMIEAEMYMPDIFKSISVGGDAKAIEDTYYWACKIYARKKEPINESTIIEYLANKVPSHSVERILLLMVKARLFEKVLDGYRPRAKKDT